MSAGQAKPKKKKEERLTVTQYAWRKQISERTVYRRIKAGLIKAEQLAPGYQYEIIV